MQAKTAEKKEDIKIKIKIQNELYVSVCVYGRVHSPRERYPQAGDRSYIGVATIAC